MAVLGAILGAIVGLVVGLVFTEWIFANNQSWPDVVPFALAVLGGLAGWQLGRRFTEQRADRTRSA
jgi:membrane protein YqaA with SNARE-associated domain